MESTAPRSGLDLEEATVRRGGGWSWAAFGYDRVRSVSEADFLPAPCVGLGLHHFFRGHSLPIQLRLFGGSLEESGLKIPKVCILIQNP